VIPFCLRMTSECIIHSSGTIYPGFKTPDMGRQQSFALARAVPSERKSRLSVSGVTLPELFGRKKSRRSAVSLLIFVALLFLFYFPVIFRFARARFAAVRIAMYWGGAWELVKGRNSRLKMCMQELAFDS
jgi:hypothetical protein